MKRILSFILCLSIIGATMLSLSACKKECKNHTDDNKDAVCDECGQRLDGYDLMPKDLFIQYKETVPTYFDEPEINSLLKNMTEEYTSSITNLVLFQNQKAAPGNIKAAVLNVDQGEIVCSIYAEEEDDDNTSTLLVLNNIIVKQTAYYIGNTITSYRSTIYDSKGREIDSRISKQAFETPTFYSNVSMFSFNDKLYRVEDNVVSYVMDLGLRSVPNFDFESDKFYYDINSDSIKVYNKDFTLEYFYEAADNANETFICPLSNGNVLIQNTIILPRDASEYDIFDGEDKYDLQTIIYDVENNVEKQIECNFAVTDMLNGLIGRDYSTPSTVEYNFSKIENLACIYKIENKIVSVDEEIVVLSNDLNVTAYLDNVIPGQNGIAMPIAPDRYTVSDKSGKTYVVNGDGNVIGECTAARFNQNTGVFESNGKYNDTDMQLILDMNDYGYTAVSSSNEYLYRQKITYSTNDQADEYEYYLFDGTAFTPANIKKNATDFVFRGDYFTYNYKSGDNTYMVFCNLLGEELIRFNILYDEYIGITHNQYNNSLLICHKFYNEKNDVEIEYYTTTLK